MHINNIIIGKEKFITVGDNASELKIKMIFPGSFNPPHVAHFEMAKMAEKITGKVCYFEISINSAIKKPAHIEDIYNRIWNLGRHAGRTSNIIISDCPYFLDKIQLYNPNAGDPLTIVAGYDTFDKFMYDCVNDEKSTSALHLFIKNNAVDFVIFGRETNLTFKLGNESEWYQRFIAICGTELEFAFRFVSQEEFANPLSSTKVRKDTQK